MGMVRVETSQFARAFEQAINGSDPEQFGPLYEDQFLFGGAQGIQVVKKEDLLRMVPMRKTHFAALGLISTEIEAMQEDILDETFSLVAIEWMIRFQKSGQDPVPCVAKSSYVLHFGAGSPKIAMQIDHQDLKERAKALGFG